MYGNIVSPNKSVIEITNNNIDWNGTSPIRPESKLYVEKTNNISSSNNIDWTKPFRSDSKLYVEKTNNISSSNNIDWTKPFRSDSKLYVEKTNNISSSNNIDWTKPFRSDSKLYVEKTKKVVNKKQKPNASCDCGSKKKYKKCCRSKQR